MVILIFYSLTGSSVLPGVIIYCVVSEGLFAAESESIIEEAARPWTNHTPGDSRTHQGV